MSSSVFFTSPLPADGQEAWDRGNLLDCIFHWVLGVLEAPGHLVSLANPLTIQEDPDSLAAQFQVHLFLPSVLGSLGALDLLGVQVTRPSLVGQASHEIEQTTLLLAT